MRAVFPLNNYRKKKWNVLYARAARFILPHNIILKADKSALHRARKLIATAFYYLTEYQSCVSYIYIRDANKTFK